MCPNSPVDVHKKTTLDKQWLLIYDNVDCWNTVLSFWPQGSSSGAIIITSRDFSLARHPASAGEELSTLTSSESSELFKSFLRSYDDNDEVEVQACNELLTYLDGLPLAIQQIASLIDSQGYSIATFLRLYKENRGVIHKERGVNSYAFYAHSIHSVWRFAFQNIALEKQTIFLLGVISLLAPDGIPKELLRGMDADTDDGTQHLEFYENEFLQVLLLGSKQQAYG